MDHQSQYGVDNGEYCVWIKGPSFFTFEPILTEAYVET